MSEAESGTAEGKLKWGSRGRTNPVTGPGTKILYGIRKKINLGAWETVQLENCLMHKCEALSLMPRIHVKKKKLGMVT